MDRPRFLSDERGVSYVEYLVLLAFLGLAGIATMRFLAASVDGAGDAVAADVEALREFQGGEVSAVQAAADQAANGALIVRVGAPTVGAMHGPPGYHQAGNEPSTILPGAGALVGGILGGIGGATVAGGATAFTVGGNAPLIPVEVLGGIAIGAAVGYSLGVVAERMQEEIAQAEQWVNERVRDSVGWLGERAGAGVDWVEERAASAVEWVKGLFSKDEGEADEQTKREAKQEQVRRDRAMREYRTNRKFRDYFHRKYKDDEHIPRGKSNNSNMDEDEVLDAWEEWEAQLPGHDVP